MNHLPGTALLLVNPQSRQGGSVDLQDGIDRLEKAGMHVISRTTESADHARQLIDEHAQEIQLVIVAGGDGAVSGVIERVYDRQILLAVLPLGTANDFARSLNIPLALPAAFETIIDCRRARINLSKANGKYFVNAAHIGLGVEVTRSLTSDVKRRWGILGYFRTLMQAFSRKRSFRVRIRADDHEHRLRTIHIAVGNGRYYGGGNIIDEESSLFDGRLSLYAVRPQRFWELLMLAPFIRSGKQRSSPRIFCCRSKKIRIETAEAFDMDADGEPLTRTPADVEVIPRALEVIHGEFGTNPETRIPSGSHQKGDDTHEDHQD